MGTSVSPCPDLVPACQLWVVPKQSLHQRQRQARLLVVLQGQINLDVMLVTTFDSWNEGLSRGR